MEIPLRHTPHAFYVGSRRLGWWRPFFARGWMMRANCALWLDGEGLHFRRHLTRFVATVPWTEVADATAGGKWWGARPLFVPSLLVRWRRRGSEVESCFAVSHERDEVEDWARAIRGRARARAEG
jgi:hypothetical protein